jgi:hypothetical protein
LARTPKSQQLVKARLAKQRLAEARRGQPRLTTDEAAIALVNRLVCERFKFACTPNRKLALPMNDHDRGAICRRLESELKIVIHGDQCFEWETIADIRITVRASMKRRRS